MGKETEKIEHRIKETNGDWGKMKEVLDLLPKKTFIVRIEELRQKTNKSHSALSTASGIATSTVSAIFNGTRNPSRITLIKLAFAMELTKDEINELLKLAGLKELYARNVDDSIIIFGLENNLELNKIDELLKAKKCKMRFCEKDDELAQQ